MSVTVAPNFIRGAIGTFLWGHPGTQPVAIQYANVSEKDWAIIARTSAQYPYPARANKIETAALTSCAVNSMPVTVT